MPSVSNSEIGGLGRREYWNYVKPKNTGSALMGETFVPPEYLKRAVKLRLVTSDAGGVVAATEAERAQRGRGGLRYADSVMPA